jgi:6-methylsalicylate decarboxylase
MTSIRDAWTRRDFLAAATTLGAAALAPASVFGTPASGFAAPASGKAKRRIDIHHHFLPQPYMHEEHERIAGFSHGAMSSDRLLNWTPEQALEVMDQNGIELAIGSISMPGVWYGDVPAARRLSRAWNEAAAKMVQDYPGRFGFFGVVAPPDPDGALEEIAYALDTLKADGIGLVSNYDGRELGDPSFAPVLEELNRRKAVVYVHPTVAPCCASLIPGLLPQMIEFPFDTTRTIASLLVSGTLARLGDIRWIFSHGGGTLPFLAARMNEIARANKEAAERNPRGIEYQLKQLYCDTASANSAPQLAAMISFFPPSHILFGSDYPFVPPQQRIEGIEHYPMSPQLRAGIDRGNALELLARLRV